MDCDVEQIQVALRTPSGRPSKRRAFVWRCRRPDCQREFPYEAVLTLMGCKSQDRRGFRERTSEDVVKIARDKDGRPVRLEYVR